MSRLIQRFVAPALVVAAAIGVASTLAVPGDGEPAPEPTPEEIARIDDLVRRFHHGQRLFGSGKDEQAEQVFRDLIVDAPETPEIYHALGLLLVFRKRPDEALDALREAVRLGPENPVILRDTGQILLDRGAAREAAPLFARARKVWPREVEVAVGHGTALRALGRLEEATAALRAAHEIDPGSVDARVGLAGCILLAEPAAALDLVSGLQVAWPDVALVHGLALARLDRHDEARPHLVRAADGAAPGVAGRAYLQEAAEALVRTGHAGDAALVATRWVATFDPPSARASFCLAMALAADGKSDQALAALDAVPADGAGPESVRRHVALFRAAVILRAGGVDAARAALTVLADADTESFERAAARRVLDRTKADWAAAISTTPGRANDVAWIESLRATLALDTESAAAHAARAHELSSPPGEYPGLLVMPRSD